MCDFAPRDGADIDAAIEQFDKAVGDLFAHRRRPLLTYHGSGLPGGDPSPVSVAAPDDRVAAHGAGKAA